MVEKTESVSTPKKPGILRRMGRKVFKRKKLSSREETLPERAQYSYLDCLRTLGQRQPAGWNGERMNSLLRIKEQTGIFGAKENSSFFCNSETAPIVSLEMSLEPKDWPKDFASWSISFHESTGALYVTIVDLNRKVNQRTKPIIVREVIAEIYTELGWENLKKAIERAERAVEVGAKNNKRFNCVLNDCGSVEYLRLKRR